MENKDDSETTSWQLGSLHDAHSEGMKDQFTGVLAPVGTG